jgi:hypothetical protein
MGKQMAVIPEQSDDMELTLERFTEK